MAAILMDWCARQSVEGIVFIGFIRLMSIRDKTKKCKFEIFIYLEFTFRRKIYQTDYPSRRIFRVKTANDVFVVLEAWKSQLG